MDLNLSPEQREFRKEVRAFIDDNLPPATRRWMRAGRPASAEEVVAFQRLLHSRGWAVPNWPAEYGGAELGLAERIILTEELQRAPAPTPQIFNTAMLGPVLLKYGSAAQKAFWLPKLASCDVWFCQGFSEPGSGSDLASLRTSAVADGDDYIVNGQKVWTTSAQVADWIFALVRTERGDRPQQGISFLLIPLDAPGVILAIGALAEGARDHMVGIALAANLSEAAGIAEQALALAIEHCRTRVQFGAPLAKKQAVRHRIADMQVAVEQIESAAILAAVAIDAPASVETGDASRAADVVVAHMRRVCESAVQLHGAIGLTSEHRIGHFLARSVLLEQSIADLARIVTQWTKAA